MESALRQSEASFREVLENSLDASYKRNLVTNSYVYLSPVFTRISGYTPEEMKTLPVESVLALMHPDDLPEINRVLAESMAESTGKPYQLEYRFKHKDGQYRWFLDQFTNFSDSTGHPIARIGSVADITLRKQLEESIRNANKLESLGLLAGGIAHNFNNLMGGIFGYMDMAIEATKEEKVTKNLTKAMNTIDRAKELTAQLLTFAKGGAPVQETAPLFPFLQETIQTVLRDSNVSGKFDIVENLWPCNIDSWVLP